LVLYPQYW